MTKQVHNDVVYLFAISTAAIGLSVSIFMLAAPEFLRAKLLLPVALSRYSTDGIITEEGIRQLDLLLFKTGLIGASMSFLALAYAALWRYFSRRLPPAQSSTDAIVERAVSRFEVILLLSILAIGLVMRMHGMTQGFTYDEIYSAMHFIEVPSTWQTMSTYLSFNNHIGYSLVARGSQYFFGNAEWAHRLPALLFGLAAIFFLWRFTRWVTGPELALLAAAALAVSPLHTLWSTQARGYSAMVFFSLVSSYLFLRLLDRSSFANAVVYVVSSVLGIYFHLYAAAIALVQIIFVVYLGATNNYPQWQLNRNSFQILWRSFVAIAVFATICYAPVLPKLLLTVFEQGRGSFELSFPLSVLRDFSGYTEVPWLIGSLVTAMLGWTFLKRHHPGAVAYFTMLLLLPLAAAWFSRPYFLFPRFFAYFVPFYLIFSVSGFYAVGTAVSKLGMRHLGPAAAITVAGVSFYRWFVNSWHFSETSGFREAGEAMERGASRFTALCAVGGNGELYQYYPKRTVTTRAQPG